MWFACQIKNTHSWYLIFTACPWQQWIRECASLLHYTFFACHLEKFCLVTFSLYMQYQSLFKSCGVVFKIIRLLRWAHNIPFVCVFCAKNLWWTLRVHNSVNLEDGGWDGEMYVFVHSPVQIQTRKKHQPSSITFPLYRHNVINTSWSVIMECRVIPPVFMHFDSSFHDAGAVCLLAC